MGVQFHAEKLMAADAGLNLFFSRLVEEAGKKQAERMRRAESR